MIYRCARCGDQVEDVAGCVEHNRTEHRRDRLGFNDFRALGGVRDAMHQQKRERLRQPIPEQLDLTHLIPED